MDDPRFGALVLVAVLTTAYGILWTLGYLAVKDLEETPEGERSRRTVLLLITITPALSVLFATFAGFIFLQLWGLFAPALGWPSIDLVTAIAIVWGGSLLFRGLSPQSVIESSLSRRDS